MKSQVKVIKVLKRRYVATKLNDRRENDYHLVHEEIVETLEEVRK